MSFNRQENFHLTYLFLSSSHLSKLSLSTLDLISLNEVQMAEMPPGPRLVQSNYAKCNSRILLLKSLLKISTRSEQKQWDNFWAAWKFKRRDGIWNFEKISILAARTFHEKFNKCRQMSIKKDIELRLSLKSLLHIWCLQVLFLGRHANKISKNIPDQQKIYTKSFVASDLCSSAQRRACWQRRRSLCSPPDDNGGVMMIVNEDGDDDFKGRWWWL